MSGITEVVEALKDVDALVVTYHGVLAPPLTPRIRAVPDIAILDLLDLLRKRRLVRIVVVAFKSFNTIHRTAERFDAAVCCNGCEIITPDTIVVPRRAEEYTHKVVEVSRYLRGVNDVTVEFRRTRFGDTVGLSIEWDTEISPSSRESVELVKKLASSKGLVVISDERAKFVEIFAPICNRSASLQILRKLLDLRKVAYVGDSAIDNEAFRLSDVSIAIRHPLNEGQKLAAQFELTRSEFVQVLKRLLSA